MPLPGAPTGLATFIEGCKGAQNPRGLEAGVPPCHFHVWKLTATWAPEPRRRRTGPTPWSTAPGFPPAPQQERGGSVGRGRLPANDHHLAGRWGRHDPTSSWPGSRTASAKSCGRQSSPAPRAAPDPRAGRGVTRAHWLAPEPGAGPRAGMGSGEGRGEGPPPRSPLGAWQAEPPPGHPGANREHRGVGGAGRLGATLDGKGEDPTLGTSAIHFCIF